MGFNLSKIMIYGMSKARILGNKEGHLVIVV